MTQTETAATIKTRADALYAQLRQIEHEMSTLVNDVEEAADMRIYGQMQLAINAEEAVEKRSEIRMVRRVTVEMTDAKAEARKAFEAIKTARAELSKLTVENFEVE